MNRGVLFVGHGTRLRDGVDECLRFTRAVEDNILQELVRQNDDDRPVFATCFLELQEPTISEAIECFVQTGVEFIDVVPLLLFSAGHMKLDIPECLSKIQEKYPKLRLTLLNPFGVDEALVTACADRIRASGWTPSPKDSVLFVGRGAKDKDALREFNEMVDQTMNRVGLSRKQVEIAFLAGSGVRLDEGLANCLQHDPENVYVVPVLLFDGLLTRGLINRVQAWQSAATKNVQTHIVPHLGIHPQLVQRLSEKVCQSLTSVQFS